MGTDDTKGTPEFGGLTIRRFLVRRKRGFVISVGVLTVVVLVALGLGWLLEGTYPEWIDSFFAVPVACATLLVAIGIGIMNTRREWTDSLPWALCLRIRLVGLGPDGKNPGPETVAVFYDIPMASPANAREWAQQLASKVMTPERLPLSLFTVDLTSDVVRAGDARFRRMAISYGVLRVPESKQGGGTERGGMNDAKPTSARLKDEYAAAGIFTEGADLQLGFRPQSAESLDEVWSQLTAGEELPTGKKN